MEYVRPYNAPALFHFPLLDGGATEDFEATPVTIAAGDVKLLTNKQSPTNLTAKTVSFTSGGTEEPTPGDLLTGATSGATCRFLGAVVTSGTWAAGTAAGEMFVYSDSGTFQAENLNNTTTGTANVATIDAALDAAGLFAHAGEGIYACGLTPTEMSCRQGAVTIRDATATEEWADTAFSFTTTGHEDAHDPQGCVLTDTLSSTTGQSASNIRLSADPGITLLPGMYFEVVGGTGVNQGGFIKTYTAGATFDVVPLTNLTTAVGNATTPSVVKFYRSGTRVPAQVIANEGTIATLDALDTAQDSQHATTQAIGYAGYKKNTERLFIFVMTDSTTHAPSAGLTVTATRSLDGAAFGACANAVAAIASGVYKITLAAADLNADVVALRFTAAGADDLNVTIKTQA